MTGRIGEPVSAWPEPGPEPAAPGPEPAVRGASAMLAEQLRHFADAVERGEVGVAVSAVVVLEREEMEPGTFGFGDADALRQAGLLSVGVVHLSSLIASGVVGRVR